MIITNKVLCSDLCSLAHSTAELQTELVSEFNNTAAQLGYTLYNAIHVGCFGNTGKYTN